MSRNTLRRAGFTLIELLVVIAIIAILIGLLLPAVQKVRAAAAKTTCSNNMKQLGLAALNYESSYGTLPPSLYLEINANAGSPGAPGYPFPAIYHSFVPYLLPYIEQDNLARQYNLNYVFCSYAPGLVDNLSVIKTPVKTLLCPATPRDISALNNATLKFGAYTQAFSASPTDYAVNGGVNTGTPALFFGYLANADTTGSMRPWLKGTGLALVGQSASQPATMVSITDGTSNTMLLAEDAGRPDRWIAGTKVGSKTDGGWADPEANYGLDGITVNRSTSPVSSSEPGNCVINCDNNNETYSFHTGGANHVFTDGSVRFIRDSIAPRTYAALISARGAGLTAEETSPSTD